MKAVKFVTAGLLFLCSSAFAGPLTFTALLNGANEVPANGSPATGFAEVVIDPVAQTMRVLVSFSGLTTGDTASHIHCCTAPGTSTGVATTLPTFTGFPSGVTSGSYDHTFDMTLSTSYNPSFVTANGGTALSAEAALFAGIESDRAYLNIHTTQFGGGEIRGFLVTPEPATFLLAGAVLAGFLIRRRR